MKKLEQPLRLLFLVMACAGLYLQITHPSFADPLRATGAALGILGVASSSFLSIRIGATESDALPRMERWICRLAMASVLVAAFSTLAHSLARIVPDVSPAGVALAVALFGLAFGMGVIRRSRMPARAQRPVNIVLDSADI